MIKSYRDLKVYGLSYELALRVFKMTRQFPKEELYSLTDQMRRSSRSIPANIAEGWSKRKYTSVFKKHLMDSLGSTDETAVWIDFAHDFGYMGSADHSQMRSQYEELGKRLYRLWNNWKAFDAEEIDDKKV